MEMTIVRLRLFAATTPFLLLLAAAPPSFAQAPPGTIPGLMYQWRILSMTGQTPANANTTLTYLSPPSINEYGAVAFVADFDGGGQGVVAASPTLAQTVVSFADPSGSRTFGTNTQINDAGQALAADDYSGLYYGRLWNANEPGAYQTLIQGGTGQTYTAVLSNGSVNKNGDAVMPTLNKQGATELVSIKGGAVAGKLQLPAGSFAFPQIADTGSILVVNGGAAASPIEIYNQALSTVQTVVANSTNFSVIGNQPGISADGNVVAFYGQPTAAGAAMNCGLSPCGSNPGIFAYANDGVAWTMVRVTGIDAELGYNDANLALSFFSYSNDSRVAVASLAGSLNSFVVSFIGTPIGASRTNPWISGFPLLFSDQQGLWTIRVDQEAQLSSPNAVVYHPTTAIKVAQIGDTIGGNVITAINVFDQLANAAEDDSGNIRTMRRGDHRVVFQASTSTGQQIIVQGEHLDSDQDGLLDHWETTGIDMDQDGVVDLNLPAMGANPNQRDLFLEIDWLSDLTNLSVYQPSPGVISPSNGQTYFANNGMPISFIVDMFNNAPELEGELFGLRSDGGTPAPIPAGITLHIDGGPLDDVAGHPFNVNMGEGPLYGGRLVTAANGALAEVVYFGTPNSATASWTNTIAFQSVKSSLFGSLDKDGRELAFHFAIFGDYYAFYTGNGTCPPTCTGANSWMVASATQGTPTTPGTLVSTAPLPPSMYSTGGDVVKIVGGTGAGQYAGLAKPNIQTRTLTLANPKVWPVTPDATSSFAILDGSTGLAEMQEQPSPDYNSLPGNDFIVAMGGAGAMGFFTYDYILGTPCDQWRTLAHELGHTLGLRHGGTDNDADKGTAYLSLMSYTWQLQCNGPNPDFPTTTVPQSYSVITDPTFWDWGNLQSDFPNVEIHLGNTLGLSFGSVPEYGEQTPEENGMDYMNQNGPPDNTPPTVKVQTPAANANVGLTLPLPVVVDATDNNQVASVTVSFDVNGNGVIDPGETLAAKLSGTTYKASFPALSGPLGTRTITASAIDGTGNSATATESVKVIEPNPVPSLISLVPPSATHGGKAFTLTVNGSKFVSGAVVEWNGASHTATFVNSGELTVKIPASDIATAGTASVTVKNPAPGGGVSNALTFTIN
jgi:hypothetical protein